MQKTSIEWVFNVDGSRPGYSCNVMTGCLNCIDGKCGGMFPCYAYLLSKGRCHHADLKGIQVEFYGGDSFAPRVHPFRFDQLDRAPKGAGIFVCDRSDWAADYWPDWCQERILNTARNRPDLRLYLLTKQPQHLIRFAPFPPNCYVGVSVCNPEMFNTAFDGLQGLGARTKFISFEPYLEPLRISQLAAIEMTRNFFDWAVIGSQTKPVKHPPFEAVSDLVDSCHRGNKAVFIKPPLSDAMNLKLEEMPEL